MSFGDAVRTCFQKYFEFSGRAARPEYWWFFLFVVAGSLLLSVVDGILFGFDGNAGDVSKTPISSLFSLATFIPSMSVAFRRLHDIGRSGWFIGAPLLLLVGAGLLLLLLLILQSGYAHGGGDAPFASVLIVGAIALGLAALGLALLTLWWATRPSELGPNRYGP